MSQDELYQLIVEHPRITVPELRKLVTTHPISVAIQVTKLYRKKLIKRESDRGTWRLYSNG